MRGVSDAHFKQWAGVWEQFCYHRGEGWGLWQAVFCIALTWKISLRPCGMVWKADVRHPPSYGLFQWNWPKTVKLNLFKHCWSHFILWQILKHWFVSFSILCGTRVRVTVARPRVRGGRGGGEIAINITETWAVPSEIILKQCYITPFPLSLAPK